MRVGPISRFLFSLTLLAGFGRASTTSYITIPATNNIQTGLISTFPTGTYAAGGTTFSIPASGNNFYDGFSIPSGNGQSITMNVSIPNPTDVYMLMNAYAPPAGATIGTVTFIATGGLQATYPLIAGQDIRDFFQGGFANTLSNGVGGVTAANAFTCTAPATCLGAGGTGNVHTGSSGTYMVDVQHFGLSNGFAGQTLTQIVLTDTNNGSEPILLGATVISNPPASPATVPISPWVIAMLVIGLAGLGFYRLRRAGA